MDLAKKGIPQIDAMLKDGFLFERDGYLFTSLGSTDNMFASILQSEPQIQSDDPCPVRIFPLLSEMKNLRK